MKQFILGHEPVIRFSFFLGILIVMAIWELLAPRRPLTTLKPTRWYSNLGFAFIDTLALRLLLPVQAVGVALYIGKHGWGILNNVTLPGWAGIGLGILGLDLVIYLQHAMFHAIPAFWRLHMVHHTDMDFDVTTGVRFHPFEILLSMGIKMAVIVLLGISALAVLIFEVLLNATAMFNHGNVRLPFGIDRVLRLLVVTPEMHRVHHSIVRRETNSNFGFNLPWWDRLMGTYRAQPAAGHEGMTIGLENFREAGDLTLPRLLILPFLYKPSHYPIGQGDSA
jgi:sterol desaturase/sphingolipid hydroxylase (fatty acid hydroxylase superfamily)